MNNAINDSSAKFPKKAYTFRLIGREFKLSQKDKPMNVLDWEIASPDTVQIGMDEYVCAGIKTRNYMMLDDQGLQYTKTLLKKLGVEVPGLTRENIDNTPEEIDWSPLENILVKALCGSKLEPLMEEGYDAEGKPIRTPLKDDTGKPITTYKFDFPLSAVICKVG